MRRLLLVALLSALPLATVFTATGCQPTLNTETGIVTDVTSTSLVAVDGFTLRASDGRTLTFSTKDLSLRNDGFPAQHLREHQALGQPVQVTYRVTDGRNDVIKLQDAPSR